MGNADLPPVPVYHERCRTLGAQTAGAGTTLAFCRALIMTYTAGWVIFLLFLNEKKSLVAPAIEQVL